MRRQRNFKPSHRNNNHKQFNGRKKIDDMYDYNWEKYRLKFLAINRECYACGEYATVVDHLVPHKGDKILFEKTNNHIPLCVNCHNFVTSKFDRGYVPGSSIEKKTEWLNRNRVSREDWNPQRVRVLPKYG